ncbi:unnamed protein product [Linum trigynum]
MNDSKIPAGHVKPGKEKGLTKEASSGHQPKMKTLSSTASGKISGKAEKATPEKGNIKGRKIEFALKQASAKSVLEDAQHPKAIFTDEAKGSSETAMAVDLC